MISRYVTKDDYLYKGMAHSCPPLTPLKSTLEGWGTRGVDGGVQVGRRERESPVASIGIMLDLSQREHGIKDEKHSGRL